MYAVLRKAAERRVLLFAVFFYIVVALLAAMPPISRALTEKQVHQQLIAAEHSLAHNSAATTSNKPVSGLPVQLTIKRLGINFPIAKGYYNIGAGNWTLDSNHVFIDAYTNPNPIISTRQKTDVVIYGHNFNDVLGKTTEMVPGDILNLRTSNGYEFNYYFVKSTAVVPSNVSILNLESKKYPVMLVTCTGLWDQDRRVMYFTPLGSPLKLGARSQGAM